MPIQPTDNQVRLNTIKICLTITADTMGVLANSLDAPFAQAIFNTTKSLLENIEVNHYTLKVNPTEVSQTIKHHKTICIELMEQSHHLLNAIIIFQIKSNTGGELRPGVQHHIGKFTEYFARDRFKAPTDEFH
jgi:hypothetical protein